MRARAAALATAMVLALACLACEGGEDTPPLTPRDRDARGVACSPRARHRRRPPPVADRGPAATTRRRARPWRRPTPTPATVPTSTPTPVATPASTATLDLDADRREPRRPSPPRRRSTCRPGATRRSASARRTPARSPRTPRWCAGATTSTGRPTRRLGAIRPSMPAGSTTCALSEGGEVVCWGSGSTPYEASEEHFVAIAVSAGVAAPWIAPARPSAGREWLGARDCAGGPWAAIDVSRAAHVRAHARAIVVVCYGTHRGLTPRCVRSLGPLRGLALPGLPSGCVYDGQRRPRLRRGDVIPTCALTADGAIECLDVGGFDGLPSGLAGDTYVALDVSGFYGCAITEGGAIACWGGRYQELRPPASGSDRYKAIGVGNRYACALTEAGEAACWEAVDKKRPAPRDLATKRYRDVSDGPFHTCALGEDGTVACWGWDHAHQAEAPPGSYTAVGSGDEHTCALTETGEAVCWGADWWGQTDAPPGQYAAMSRRGVPHLCPDSRG